MKFLDHARLIFAQFRDSRDNGTPRPWCRSCWTEAGKPAAYFYTRNASVFCSTCGLDTPEADTVWTEWT